MREHDLYPHIIVSAKQEGVLLFRVHDTPAARNPFDLAGTVGNVGACRGPDPSGMAVAVEVKVVRRFSTGGGFWFDWASFEAQQQSWLKAYAEAGALAIAAIYYEDQQIMFYVRLVPDMFPDELLGIGKKRYIGGHGQLYPFSHNNQGDGYHSGKLPKITDLL